MVAMKIPNYFLLLLAKGLFISAQKAEVPVPAIGIDLVVDDAGAHLASCSSGTCHNNSTSFIQNNHNTTINSSLAAAKGNTLSDGIVHELGLDNFHSVVGSSSFTIVLFYDANELKLPERTDASRKHAMLHHLASEFAAMPQPRAFFLRNLRINFGLIDTRQHSELRRNYLRWDGAGKGEVYEQFYEFWDDLKNTWSEVPNTMVNSTTFMALSPSQLPYFPSEWAILHGDDFNLVNCLDAQERANPLIYGQVRDWFMQQLRNELHFAMQGPHQPRLPFRESEDGPRASVRTQITREQNQRAEYLESDPMSTIDWVQVRNHAQQQKEKKSTVANAFQPELFQVVHDNQGETHYKYRLEGPIKGEYDAELMETLAKMTEIYLAWADSYENLWDEQRRGREDERTHYGQHLATMTSQLRDAFFSAYDDLDEDSAKFLTFVTEDEVPVQLKDYFQDMLFGFGRSRKSLNAYLEEHVYSKMSVEEVKNIDLFQRIRGYMAVREHAGYEHRQYGMFFRTLAIKFHAILAEFHNNLSHDYLQYLKNHPKETKKLYKFAKMDVFDMKDPENYDLLSDYDEFQRRYVAARKPFILSNVEMTKPYNYTLELLSEKCGFADATSKVHESMALGDQSVKGWGGLKDYELPRELMTSKRNAEMDVWDESLSLGQFIELAKYFDNIYLHDMGLRTKCTSLFWDKSPYDPPEQQYFRIPAVIGRYDLFQKLPSSDYQYSWPSLFIGRKGSNSKLHIDSGATGFWMFLVSGRKRWVVYDESERPYLYERIEKSSFMADVLALNGTQNEEDRTMIHDYFTAHYPLLDLANSEGVGYEIIQEPGDLVYIPPGLPHAVENLEDIVGISFNQVPKSGITNHLFNLIHNKREFAEVEIILRYFIEEPEKGFAFAERNEDDPRYTTLGAYMAQ